MAWNYERARARIDRLIAERPSVLVEDIELRRRFLSEGAGVQLGVQDALISIPRDTAVVVDGVHVYARLSNYDEYRLVDGRETEASHKRALGFLHLLYGAMDRTVQDFGAQRVDYHGARLHCVIVDPVGNEAARVLKALALAQALQGLVRLANREIARFDYEPRLKIGIDTGTCVAINDGKGCEQEPLFLGSAANYAAKLADGPGDGIFPSNRVRSVIGVAPLHRGLEDERSTPVRATDLLEFRNRAYVGGFDLPPNLTGDQTQISRLINEWRTDINENRATTGGADAFRFHVHTPPLRSIDYNDLSPGNSIRMVVASIFADLVGYTAYIDMCMRSGRAGDAVRALHVIRGEFHNVLRDDFESRKVRYIGDCIHGLLAFGTAREVDWRKTAQEAITCAAALQASFEIIQQRLGGLQDLGLATGIEVGETPISRIGIRGERSVRVASSTATIQSQAEQERLEGWGIAVGPVAFELLSFSARRYFNDRSLRGVDYDDVAYLFVAAAPALAAAAAGAHEIRPHEEFRPHCDAPVHPLDR
jgi:class 3 adenylate cyclase